MLGKLSEMIENKYHRFLLREKHSPSTGKPEDIELSKEAFLYVVQKYRADQCNKLSRLCQINAWQSLKDYLRDEEILSAFEDFTAIEDSAGRVLPLEELSWVKSLVKSLETQSTIEKKIYLSLLKFKSSDDPRRAFKWRITEAERLALVLEGISNKYFSGDRELEIALEFNRPDPHRLDQFRRFLRSGEFGLAKKLGILGLDIVEEEIREEYRASLFEEALNMANCFLPSDHPYIKEIQEVIDLIPPKER